MADLHEKERIRIFGRKKGSFSPEEMTMLPPNITNEQKSEVEIYEFINNPPDKYFLYIDEKKAIATTWMGDRLGNVTFGRAYRTGFGDTRVPIDVYGINNIKYHGIYYKSAGDYARITAYKR